MGSVILWFYYDITYGIDLALKFFIEGKVYITLSFTTHMYVLLVCMYPDIPYTLVLHWRCGEVTLSDQSKFEKMGSVNFYSRIDVILTHCFTHLLSHNYPQFHIYDKSYLCVFSP